MFLLLLPPAAQGQMRIALQPPGPREFVLDSAGLLHPDDRQQIVSLCDRLLTDKAIPIIVVTVPSLAECGGAGLRIETFALLLFDQWGIGRVTLGGRTWNTGILLLVARDDRQARIQLGASWESDRNDICQQIMDERIIPHFEQGEFSEGILAGVKALERMALDLPLPKNIFRVRRSLKWYLLRAGLVALGLFTVVSLIRRGSNGWAYLFWGAVLGAVGTVLYYTLTRSSGGSGGGFSGGSFGGGFSGGGGATGSW